MADMDSSSLNSSHYYQPYPFMQEQDHPFQHGIPEEYDFDDYSDIVWNPTVVDTPESFLPPQNLHYNQSSGSARLMDQVKVSNIVPGGLEDLDYAMEGLSLGNNPFGNTYSSVGQYSGSNIDYGTNLFNMYEDGYDYEYQSQSLLQKRINAASTALRLRDLFGHSDPNTSNLMTERNFHAVVNNNRNNSYNNLSRGDYGVLGSYHDNYRPRMERSRASVLSPQVQVQQPRHNFNSLEDVRGKVVSLAKDHCGCRFLQLMIDGGTSEDIDMILSEVKDHTHDLMTHHFGNYLIQKIFEARRVSVAQMNNIFHQIIQDVRKLKDVCMNNHGTRAVQRMLENLKTPTQICEIINVMCQITVPLMKNVNGGYVIQQCVKLYPSACKRVILNQIARNCVEIAIDKSGCSVIQKCMTHAEGEAIMPLVEAIISSATVLAEDEYGNYVMKFLVEMKILPVNAKIISELRGKYVQLCMNKYASNVVQHLLKNSQDKHTAIIVLEIMGSREFLNVLQDPFGNYVSQTAVDFTEGPLLKRLLNAIFSYQGSLSCHPYGKRVLDCAKRRKARC